MTDLLIFESILQRIPSLLDGHTWVVAVINGAWQGIAIAALVTLALRLWRRSNASTRFVVWGATLAVVLILPALNIAADLLAPVLPRPVVSEVFILISQGSSALPVDWAADNRVDAKAATAKFVHLSPVLPSRFPLVTGFVGPDKGNQFR